MLNLFRLSSSRRERLVLYRIIRTLFLGAGVAMHALAQSSQSATVTAGAVDRSSAPVSERTAEAAAKDAAQNPVAAAISVPFQNNTYYGVGPYRRAENILLVEPVLPFKISSNWIRGQTKWIS